MQNSAPPDKGLGLTWLIKARLAGLAMPGRQHSLEQDLLVLGELGIGLLISLTEEWTPPSDLLAALGIESAHVPIPDFEPPSQAQAVLICQTIEASLRVDVAVALHCRAGKGRTGTALAAFQIWNGMQAADAISSVRKVNPNWIETQSQIDFLSEFEANCRQP